MKLSVTQTVVSVAFLLYVLTFLIIITFPQLCSADSHQFLSDMPNNCGTDEAMEAFYQKHPDALDAT